MTPTDDTAPDAPQRTSALALWRYAHDYLHLTKMLCARHHVRCDESQVPFHLMAQAIEFALKAHLRANGMTPRALADDIGHSLDEALQRAVALGLPPLPAPAHAAVAALAPHHCNDAFHHVTDVDAFPDLDPLFAAAAHVLDAIAEEVAADYVAGYAGPGSPTTADFVRRLRADLSATIG
jgi:hypothetical protein